MSEKRQESKGCAICGKPLEYIEAREMTCSICGKKYIADAVCVDGHYVCDDCHQAPALASVIPYLLQSDERDPLALFEQVIGLEGVHMHGPEHHYIVPCVLLTSYVNCGGDIDLKASLITAIERGRKVPGGTCGFYGACGAAIGAGIFMSIVTGSSPLSQAAWPVSQTLVAKALMNICDGGGPRCCKRTGRQAIESAADFTKEYMGISMDFERVRCDYCDDNMECLKEYCRYY